MGVLVFVCLSTTIPIQLGGKSKRNASKRIILFANVIQVNPHTQIHKRIDAHLKPNHIHNSEEWSPPTLYTVIYTIQGSEFPSCIHSHIQKLRK